MLHNIIDSTKPDVIMATETFNQTITDNRISPTYNLSRNDRNSGIEASWEEMTPRLNLAPTTVHKSRCRRLFCLYHESILQTLREM